MIPELSVNMPIIQDPEDLIRLISSELHWYERPDLDPNVSQPFQVLIRKRDMKLYKYDVKCKNIEKVFARCKDDYLDPLDKNMLLMRHKQKNLTVASRAPKWLNMCWDSFRHVDNHNKSHIFQPKLVRVHTKDGADLTVNFDTNGDETNEHRA